MLRYSKTDIIRLVYMRPNRDIKTTTLFKPEEGFQRGWEDSCAKFQESLSFTLRVQFEKREPNRFLRLYRNVQRNFYRPNYFPRLNCCRLIVFYASRRRKKREIKFFLITELLDKNYFTKKISSPC